MQSNISLAEWRKAAQLRNQLISDLSKREGTREGLLEAYPRFLDEVEALESSPVSKVVSSTSGGGHASTNAPLGSKRERPEDGKTSAPTELVNAPLVIGATCVDPDYQGRSYLHLPTTISAADTIRPGSRACKVPKRPAFVCNGQGAGVNTMRWALPYSQLLFAGDLKGVVKVWDVASGAACREPRAVFTGHRLPLSSLCVANEGRVLTTASQDGMLRVWDTEGCALLRTCTFGNAASGKSLVGCGAHLIHPENRSLLVAAFDKDICMYDLREPGKGGLEGSPPVARMYHGNMGAVLSLDWVDRNGNVFVSSSTDKSIRTWDFRVATQIKQMIDPAMHAVSHVVKHPNEPTLAAQCLDDTVRKVTIDVGGKLRLHRDQILKGHSVSGTSCELSFSSDGQFISTGDATGKLLIWNWATGEIVKQFAAHKQVCTTHLWHTVEPSKLLTSSWDGVIKAWM